MTNWTKDTKTATTWSGTSKNSTSWTKDTKTATDWSSVDKNLTSYDRRFLVNLGATMADADYTMADTVLTMGDYKLNSVYTKSTTWTNE